MENKQIVFDLNKLEIISSDEDISIVRLSLLHTGENRNKYIISKETVLKSIGTFYNKPIIYTLDNKYFPKASTDVQQHIRDSDDGMRIAGIIPESSEFEFVIDESNGKEYLEMIGIIYKIYQPTLMSILERRHGETKISIEIAVNEVETLDNGLLDIKDMKLQGVALLGAKIVEGIENSHMNVIKFTKDLNTKYMKFSKHDEIEHAQNKVSNIIQLYKNNKINLTEKEVVVLNSLLKKDIDKEEIDVLHSIEEVVSMKKTIGKIIKVDKSKDVMSNEAWGDEDKSQLRKEVSEATNAKDIVHDIFLQVEDGWEQSPSTKLKYPVMELKGDTAVYNRNGLTSALGYARAEKDTQVINKLESIYKELELDKKKEDENLNKEVIVNALDEDNKAIEKIKDDVVADEDDVKEKLDTKAIKNVIEPTDEGEKELEDDEDSDKDYWEKKFKKLEIVKNALEEECAKFKRTEVETNMNKLVQEFANCFSDEDKTMLDDEIKTSKTEEEFANKCFARVAKNAKAAKEALIIKNSRNSIASNMGYRYNEEETKGTGLDKVLKKYANK